MLVLTRKEGEQIVIDNKTSVTILGIKGGKVRLGIEAPKDVPVHRREVNEQINAENLASDQG